MAGELQHHLTLTLTPNPSPHPHPNPNPHPHQARGLSKTAELKKSAGKTWQSANDVDSSAMGGLGSLSAMRGPL